jgi:hypothetical protein
LWSRPPEQSSSSLSPLADRKEREYEEPHPKKRKKAQKGDRKGKPPPKSPSASDGPNSFKELMDLPPAQRVGVWSSNCKQDASVLKVRRKGKDYKYSVEKLRGELGAKACLPTHCADLQKLKYVRCLNPNEPGHEPEGSAHQVNAKFNAKWNHPVTGEAFRSTFEV